MKICKPTLYIYIILILLCFFPDISYCLAKENNCISLVIYFHPFPLCKHILFCLFLICTLYILLRISMFKPYKDTRINIWYISLMVDIYNPLSTRIFYRLIVYIFKMLTVSFCQTSFTLRYLIIYLLNIWLFEYFTCFTYYII
jgi:hypothetical protein